MSTQIIRKSLVVFNATVTNGVVEEPHFDFDLTHLICSPFSINLANEARFTALLYQHNSADYRDWELAFGLEPVSITHTYDLNMNLPVSFQKSQFATPLEEFGLQVFLQLQEVFIKLIKTNNDPTYKIIASVKRFSKTDVHHYDVILWDSTCAASGLFSDIKGIFPNIGIHYPLMCHEIEVYEWNQKQKII